MRVRIHVAALSELRTGSRVDTGAERIDEEEAVSLDGADVSSEKRQHKRFLRLQNLQSQKREPADAENNQSRIEGKSRPEVACLQYSFDDQIDAEGKQGDRQNQNRHAKFPRG